MKAIILAAGLGTRLKPYTDIFPKPLFPVLGEPVLGRLIKNLIKVGVDGIIVNTHHISEKIHNFLTGKSYPIPVTVSHEPTILGTGGAVKNVFDFLDDAPFILINSDILTDLDIHFVYQFHMKHEYMATLVLHDYPEFNNVSVTRKSFIAEFLNRIDPEKVAPTISNGIRTLAFTGIQVLDPDISRFFPREKHFSIIDAYRLMIKNGAKVQAFIAENFYWKDIGTPENYKGAVYERMAPLAFKYAYSDFQGKHIKKLKLKGDGSDRLWYRLKSGTQSIIMVDHGIKEKNSICEVDSFVDIGIHLRKKQMPVPMFYLYDRFSGLVFMEDLGDVSLQYLVECTKDREKIELSYKTLIQKIIDLSIDGITDFNTAWTYQTPCYDHKLIVENECQYFVNSFLKSYLHLTQDFDSLYEEFDLIADRALASGIHGFMHRDMQSRNIMVKKDNFYFIDFQGGRVGPIQYDLASLMIDPYVKLPFSLQKKLVQYAYEILSEKKDIDKEVFFTGYKYCALSRNLQILGAFGFLSKVKGKTFFEKYIPHALTTLFLQLNTLSNSDFPNLKILSKTLR